MTHEFQMSIAQRHSPSCSLRLIVTAHPSLVVGFPSGPFNLTLLRPIRYAIFHRVKELHLKTPNLFENRGSEGSQVHTVLMLPYQISLEAQARLPQRPRSKKRGFVQHLFPPMQPLTTPHHVAINFSSGWLIQSLILPKRTSIIQFSRLGCGSAMPSAPSFFCGAVIGVDTRGHSVFICHTMKV